MSSLYPKLIVYACVLALLISSIAPAVSAQGEDPVIIVIGDSLSAGYGMALEESWPRLLQNRLDDNGQRYRVLNSSITGDTTQGGLARLPRLLDKYVPEVVIIELGGNDGLRGLSLDVTRGNLSNMIEQSQGIGAQVVLTGIMLPPNYGASYTEQFQAMYGELAEQFDLMLVPFLMEGVALVDGMMQADGIHPNAAAQPVMLDNVWNVLGPALSP